MFSSFNLIQILHRLYYYFNVGTIAQPLTSYSFHWYTSVCFWMYLYCKLVFQVSLNIERLSSTHQFQRFGSVGEWIEIVIVIVKVAVMITFIDANTDMNGLIADKTVNIKIYMKITTCLRHFQCRMMAIDSRWAPCK